ncbi:hypothetical protein HYFRA_00011582 [Hymenoscyphus fraxineus]|uniref:Uncharacterized protein n=1 Tax=Hymenoscyphus fraxineus TaxID=746836 RepID=A0A9N9L3D2_9HELO|nr:hypothetical protein HYFRA_00011582 [Hymenoscyphus fraxineus]
MAPINRLGDFSRLPLEIRQQIWSEFQPQHLQGNQQLAILCTSSHLYEEVSAEIFKHQEFNICIPARCGQNAAEDSDDESPQPEGNSHITITNNFYNLWQIESFQHAVSIGFGPQGFPWHKVPRIRIEIEAPSPDDGELICVYKRTRDLIELIERPGRNFKNIEIFFKDTEGTEWFRARRTPYITVVGCDILGSEDEEIVHFEVVLDLFNRLRNFKSAKVHTTQSPLWSRLEAPFEQLQNILVEPTPFGYFKKRTQSLDIDDKVTRQRLGDRYLMMERFLDNVPQAVEGRSSTANCLRLERFASWYSDCLHGQSKYETDIMKIIFSGKRSLKDLQLEIFCLDHRYRLMRAYKPFAVHLWNEFEPSEELPPDEASWDEEKWRREWPQGINGLEPVWDFVAANLPDEAFRSDIDTVLMLWKRAMVPFPNWYKWRFECFLQAFPGVTDGPQEDFWRMNYFRDKVSERRYDLENFRGLCQESFDNYGELAWPLRKEREPSCEALTPKEVREWRGKFKRGLR